jgi:hypothetical protein
MKVVTEITSLLPVIGVTVHHVDVPSMDEFRDLKGRVETLKNNEIRAIWQHLGDEVERRLFIASRRIALRASNGKYVSVDLNDGQEAVLKAKWATEIKDWETFTVIDCGDGCVALRAANGKYVRSNAEPNNNRLVAWAKQIEGWERFRVSYQGDFGIALRAHNGCFVGAAVDNDGHLAAWRPNDAAEWEQFRWQAVPYEFSTAEQVATLLRNGQMREVMDDLVEEKLRILDEKLSENRRILEETRQLLCPAGK